MKSKALLYYCAHYFKMAYVVVERYIIVLVKSRCVKFCDVFEGVKDSAINKTVWLC